jgi:hypothetical protein
MTNEAEATPIKEIAIPIEAIAIPK